MTTTSDQEFREIESAGAPTRFARGWHCLGLLKDFQDGKPHQVKAFGTELVVFQGEKDGQLHILDAYCRHMGGNLAKGQVKGDSIACPFHDWRWGGNGRCTGIPYARRVPPVAKTKSWPTLERNGQLFVWHDVENSKPTDEITIPELPGYGTDEWTDWNWSSIVIKGSHCREIVDNVVDMAHFFYIHFAFPRYFKNVFEGHIAGQIMHSTPRDDVGIGSSYDNPDSRLESEAHYYGPSYMVDVLRNYAGDRLVETDLINCHYPIDNDSFVLMYGARVKKLEGMTVEQGERMAAKFTEGVKVGFEQDVAIWLDKAPIDNPLLSEEDGPVYQLRRWYQQFYTDIADVTEDMTKRFEFEIDTTRAVESWQAEVDENIAAGRVHKASS